MEHNTTPSPGVQIWAARCIVAAAVAAGIWLALRYLTGILLPPLAGYALAAGIRRIGGWLSRHSGDRKFGLGPAGERVCGMILAAALCLLLFWGIYKITALLAGEAGELMERAAYLWDPSALPEWLISRIPPTWQEQISRGVVALVEKAAGGLASFAGALVSSLPGAALSAVVIIASIFYWIVDREGILSSLDRMIPEPWKNSGIWRICTAGSGRLLHRVGELLRAYISITAILFFLFSCGLRLLQIPAPVAWAFLIALVDLLPLLGAGVVLLPWAIWMFLVGQTGKGVGIVLLWALAWLLRQWLEPRMLGKLTGTHPYLMLLLLYGGYRLGGVFGILLAALSASFLMLTRETG